MAREKKEKIDVGWIDEFNEKFKFIHGAVDLAAAGLVYDAPVEPASVAAVLEEVSEKLGKLDDLVQGFWLQARQGGVVPKAETRPQRR